MRMLGAEAIIESLKNEGVEIIFGYPGGAVLDIYDAIHTLGVKWFSDDGVGMEESVRRRIYDPFFTTRRGQGGSGLGMHIVYNLVVQTLEGSIECVSGPGKGTRFILRFAHR